MKTILIKEKSIQSFFSENLIKNNNIINNNGLTYSGGFDNSDSLYPLSNKEFYMKKNDLYSLDTEVVFEFNDFLGITKQEVSVKYTYRVEYYDQITVKFVLSDFEIIIK